MMRATVCYRADVRASDSSSDGLRQGTASGCCRFPKARGARGASMAGADWRRHFREASALPAASAVHASPRVNASSPRACHPLESGPQPGPDPHLSLQLLLVRGVLEHRGLVPQTITNTAASTDDFKRSAYFLLFEMLTRQRQAKHCACPTPHISFIVYTIYA